MGTLGQGPLGNLLNGFCPGHAAVAGELVARGVELLEAGDGDFSIFVICFVDVLPLEDLVEHVDFVVEYLYVFVLFI